MFYCIIFFRSDVRSSPSQIGAVSIEKNKDSKQDKNTSSEMTSSLVKSYDLAEKRWSGDNLSKFAHQNKEVHSQDAGDYRSGLATIFIFNEKNH